MWRSLVFGLLLAAAGSAQAEELLSGELACGSLHARGQFGPFDYRVAPAEPKALVEGAHFTSEVRALVRGNAGTIGADIDYTLRAFPNHPEALLSMMNLSFKEKTKKPVGTRWPVECYFDRGERWRGDDSNVKLLFGIYLLRLGRNSEALVKLDAAEKLASEDPNLFYNLGLAFFDLKQYDRALTYAHRAYALNFPLPGLRDKLRRAGAWKDAPPRPIQSAPPVEAAAPPEEVAAPPSVERELEPEMPQSAP